MKKRKILLGLLLGLAPVLLIGCLFFGSSGIGLPDLHTEIGRSILLLRVSRLFSALIVGGALSGAGCVFQALLRNPLSEPYVLGVSSGAALGAGAAILLGAGSGLLLGILPLAAFVGGTLTMGMVLLIAGGSRASIYTLILSGVIVSSMGSSILMFLVSTASNEGLHSVVWWMLGNLQPASGTLLWSCALLILAGLVGLWWFAPDFNILTLGRDAAHHMGVRTEVVITCGLLLATLVTSAAVALAGLIGFVGLIVPHAVRAISGADHRRLIPVAALSGGVFLAVCDAVARTMMPLCGAGPIEIPVGVLTAICGGPFFLVILKLSARRGWIGEH